MADDRFRPLMQQSRMYGDRSIRLNNCVESIENAADSIEQYCPESRARSLALTKLEECLMWIEKSLC